MPRPARTYADVYDSIQTHVKFLREGVVVAIDPSIGSTSSMPGYAVYRNSKLLTSGIFEITPTDDKPTRLRRLVHLLRDLYNQYDPDILVYEELSPRRYGGGSAHGHASLLKALGAILSVSGPTGSVGLPPTMWTKLKRSGYVKGDAEDAVEMGWIAIDIASRTEPKKTRRYGQKKSGSSKRGKTKQRRNKPVHRTQSRRK